MKKTNLQFCNILDRSTEQPHLWQFSTGNNRIALTAERAIIPNAPLPAKAVGKDWKTLWQKKLNIAWLPADQVFLHVIHLPAADFTELHSMVEFQLEKLSPLPVNQIVWSIEPLPKAPEAQQQTVIIIVAARSLVEEFVGDLEQGGYQPDRLELPQIHQLLAHPVDGNSVWIYPSTVNGLEISLVAWWFGGTLQQLQLLYLPANESKGAALVEQLTKTAWAGEVEGWLATPFQWVLVADAQVSAFWEPILKQWTGNPIRVVEPISQSALAEIAAKRAANEETKSNLLPGEYAARYRQQFIDKLWMTGLGAVIAAYIAGVLVYFSILQVANFQLAGLQKKVAALSGSYTNAVRLGERLEVLQDQLNLKYAALDSLRITSELLPPDLTLNNFRFDRGQKLTLEGTAPQDQVSQMIDFNDSLRKARIEGQPLFSDVEQPKYEIRGQNISWRFTCSLYRQQTE